MGRYDGKTAVITGGSTGIGLTTAQLLVREGATVVVTARSKSALDAAVSELGPRAFSLVSDTSKLSDIDQLVSFSRQKLAHVDFLFLNAGIAKFIPFESVNEAFFDEQFDVNIKGAFFAAQKLLPLMRSGSSIVMNTSVAGEKGMPSTTVYAATKAALRSLARTLAGELAPKGIRVNALSPGPITTPIYDKLAMPKDAQKGFENQMRESNPMKRFGSTEEVARSALYLAFDATYTTGAELPVDGGLTQL
jgi:NAD(P)-dependent dehydrogenase (short-subunit alcohol dehydrogenase family)